MQYTFDEIGFQMMTGEANIYINDVLAEIGSMFETGDMLRVEPKAGFGLVKVSLFIEEGDWIMGTDDVYSDFNLADGVATLEVPSNFVNYTSPIRVEAEEQQIEGFMLRESDMAGLDAVNSILFVNGVLAEAGSIIKEGDELVIEVQGLFNYVSASIFIDYDPVDPFAEEVYQDFNLAGDLKSGSLILQEDIGNVGNNIFNEIVVEVADPEVTGVNKVYQVDSDIVSEINSERFVENQNGIFDYGQFIIGLIELPTSIPEEFIAGNNSIKLADRTLTVSAPEVVTDNLSLNMGSISVPREKDNLEDYSNVVFNLHLPYATSVVIDSEYIIGETISIEYLIDLYSGEATINISSTKVDGKVFMTQQANLGVNVPYTSTSSVNLTSDNINITKIGDNRILKPFLEMVKKAPYLVDGFFTIPIVDEDLLENQTGFIRVDEVELKGLALVREKELILNQLKNGVIINE